MSRIERVHALKSLGPHRIDVFTVPETILNLFPMPTVPAKERAHDEKSEISSKSRLIHETLQVQPIINDHENPEQSQFLRPGDAFPRWRKLEDVSARAMPFLELIGE